MLYDNFRLLFYCTVVGDLNASFFPVVTFVVVVIVVTPVVVTTVTAFAGAILLRIFANWGLVVRVVGRSQLRSGILTVFRGDIPRTATIAAGQFARALWGSSYELAGFRRRHSGHFGQFAAA